MFKKVMIAGLCTAVLLTVVRVHSDLSELVTEVTPMGIVSFELAESRAAAEEMMAVIGKSPLKVNIILDFFLLIAYSCFFFFCCQAFISFFTKTWQRWMGYLFLELSVLAGLLDFIENVAMLITLSENITKTSVWVSRHAAIAKFGIIALVVVYIIMMILVSYFYNKRRKAHG
jgi:uncharacterized membrane protein